MGFFACWEAGLNQERSSVVQGGAKLAPRWFPDCPKRPLRTFKMAPKWP